jgi:hypothetical protein
VHVGRVLRPVGAAEEPSVLIRVLDLAGPILCTIAGLCFLAGLIAGVDSDAARALMLAGALLFLPGAFLTLVYVRRYYGPGR